MLRKTIIALAASATLGAAALAPSTASAWGGHWGGHGFFHPGFRVFASPGYDGCVVQRWVRTGYGPVPRWVNRCY